AIGMLDQCGETLHPVAIICVEGAVDGAQLGVMDMAAYHAVEAPGTRLATDCRLEVADVADRPLDLQLQVPGERPVSQAQPRADRVQPMIELERDAVERVADMGEPARALDHAVEAVPVHDPEFAIVRRDMDCFVEHFDAAEEVPHEAPRELVVVAGDEDDPGPLARLAQQLLDHVIVRLGPVPLASQLPAVDDVADQVQVLAGGKAEEVQQGFGLATRRAQVQVRDPDAAVVDGFAGGFGIAQDRYDSFDAVIAAEYRDSP